MSGSAKTIFKYVSTDTTIEILPEFFSTLDTQLNTVLKYPFVLKNKLTLKKIKQGFIDSCNRLIYVRQKYYNENPDITYIIDGKTYIQDMGIQDGHGLIKKPPRTNKALQKKLKNIDKNNCTIEVFRGLSAYEKYGIKRVYGVIAISTKKKNYR